jgi:hypothetical protein
LNAVIYTFAIGIAAMAAIWLSATFTRHQNTVSDRRIAVLMAFRQRGGRQGGVRGGKLSAY